MPALDPLLGAAIGRYELVRVIGEGGMGRVYEGVNPEIGSRVAIKVLAAQFASDAELCERMFAEARAVNLIHHRGIVPALDLVRLADGRPVIVMELVRGRSMRDVFAARAAPLGAVVDMMLQVLDVLVAAHAAGIVHRDLKPDNILIADDGQAKVLDFGIAKLLHTPADQRGPRTRTGVVLGTPVYMAPEHISGGVTDESVDLYALGVMLFEGTTGRLPFEGATDFDVMRAHVDTPPPSARALRPEVPVELERVIERALAKHPRDRYESATAMANALRVAAQALPDAASPARPGLTKLATDPVDAFLPTKPGRLGVATAPPAPRPRPEDRPTVAERAAPVPAPPPQQQPPVARARWVAPVIASIATAGVFAVVLAVIENGRDAPMPSARDPEREALPNGSAVRSSARDPEREALPDGSAVRSSAPVVLAHAGGVDAALDAAPPVAPAAPMDAAGRPPDASGRRATPAPAPADHPAAHPDDLFSFGDAAGFETCLETSSLVITKGGQTRTLDRGEIVERCVDAAVQRLAAVPGTAGSAPYIAAIKASGTPSALAIPLVDFFVRRSRSSCNDMPIYKLLVDVLSQGEFVSEHYLAPAQATIARCLKDDAFRKDFLDELHSDDANLARGACVILTQQKLVTSCN